MNATIYKLLHASLLGVASFVLVTGTSAAQEETSREATSPQRQTTAPREFGQSYATLRPEQKRLVDDFVRRYNQTTESEITPEQAYDGARISVRTTFDAVTHTLLTTALHCDDLVNLAANKRR